MPACKVYNETMKRAASLPRGEVSLGALSTLNLAELVKLMFESHMACLGFKNSEYVMSKGFQEFRKLFEAKQLQCWWPASAAAEAGCPEDDSRNVGV